MYRTYTSQIKMRFTSSALVDSMLARQAIETLVNCMQSDISNIQDMHHCLACLAYDSVVIVAGMILGIYTCGMLYMILTLAMEVTLLMTSLILFDASAKYETKLIVKKDIRVDKIRNMVSRIKYVKLNTTEDMEADQIARYREDELKVLLKIGKITSWWVLFGWLSTTISMLAYSMAYQIAVTYSRCQLS